MCSVNIDTHCPKPIGHIQLWPDNFLRNIRPALLPRSNPLRTAREGLWLRSSSVRRSLRWFLAGLHSLWVCLSAGYVMSTLITTSV